MLELPKFTRSADELATPLDAWLYFLRYAEGLDTVALPPALRVPEIERGMEVLTMVTQSDLERERYEARLKIERDMKSRIYWQRMIERINVYQELLGRPLTSEAELMALPGEEVKRLLEELKQQLIR